MEYDLIRRSPVVLIKHFVVFQFFFSFLILIILFVLSSSKPELSSSGTSVFIISIIEVISLIFLFANWYMDQVYIYGDKIIHKYGIVMKHEKVLMKSHDYSYQTSQSLFGRIFKYQTLSIKFLEEELVLYSLTSPSVEIIIKNLDKVDREKENGDALKVSTKYLLQQEENINLEFKSTLRWDLKENKVNKRLEESVLKNIAAFLNSKGGVLIIGVDDKKKLLGLDNDYDSLKRKNSDGFENHMNQLIKKYFGIEFLNLIDITFEVIEGVELCRINVETSPKPVIVEFEGTESFFVRTGNAVTALSLKEALVYYSTNYKNISN